MIVRRGEILLLLLLKKIVLAGEKVECTMRVIMDVREEARKREKVLKRKG